MDRSDRAKIPAYLLGKLSEEERHAFEASLLEDPELLSAVQMAENEFLRTVTAPRFRVTKACAGCFLLGAAGGAALTELLEHLLRAV
jgi:anti-sigma factor RsiW